MCRILRSTLALLLLLASSAFAETTVRVSQAGWAEVRWDASVATPNVTIAKYLVGIRTASTPEVIADAGLSLTYRIDGLQGGVAYTVRVFAESTALVRSASSNEVTFTLETTVPDTTLPSAPTGLQGSGASLVQINLSWVAATDNVAVTGYGIFRNTLKIADVTTTTTFSDTNLLPATTYGYTVQARDAAGNLSPMTATVFVATLGDTTAPSQPTLLQAVPTMTTVQLSWDESIDNVGVAGYRILRNGSQIAVTSAVTYLDTALTAGTNYTYSVAAFDVVGNTSPATPITAQTLPSTPSPCMANGKPYTIGIAIANWTKRVTISSATGPRGRVDFSLQNSFPVVLVQVKFGTQVIGEIPASDLRDVLAMGFSTPRVPGVYSLFITAKDAGGCVTTTTIARTVTVVP